MYFPICGLQRPSALIQEARRLAWEAKHAENTAETSCEHAENMQRTCSGCARRTAVSREGSRLAVPGSEANHRRRRK